MTTATLTVITANHTRDRVIKLYDITPGTFDPILALVDVGYSKAWDLVTATHNDDDSMAECPRCGGQGEIHGGEDLCPLCFGKGGVHR